MLCCAGFINHGMTTTDRTEMYDVKTSCFSVLVFANARWLQLMQFQLMCSFFCSFRCFRSCGSCTCNTLIHRGVSRCCRRGYHVDNVFRFPFVPVILSVCLHGHPVRRYTARPRGVPLSKCSMRTFVPTFLCVASPRAIPPQLSVEHCEVSR